MDKKEKFVGAEVEKFIEEYQQNPDAAMLKMYDDITRLRNKIYAKQLGIEFEEESRS